MAHLTYNIVAHNIIRSKTHMCVANQLKLIASTFPGQRIYGDQLPNKTNAVTCVLQMTSRNCRK